MYHVRRSDCRPSFSCAPRAGLRGLHDADSASPSRTALSTREGAGGRARLRVRGQHRQLRGSHGVREVLLVGEDQEHLHRPGRLRWYGSAVRRGNKKEGVGATAERSSSSLSIRCNSSRASAALRTGLGEAVTPLARSAEGRVCEGGPGGRTGPGRWSPRRKSAPGCWRSSGARAGGSAHREREGLSETEMQDRATLRSAPHEPTRRRRRQGNTAERQV